MPDFRTSTHYYKRSEMWPIPLIKFSDLKNSDKFLAGENV